MQDTAHRVYPKPVYFTKPITPGVDTTVAYSPSVLGGALRTTVPALSIIFDRNYLLMDPASFHAYNGLYFGCVIAVVVNDDTDETENEFEAFGKMGSYAQSFTTVDAAADWLMGQATNTQDKDFYVLLDPDRTRLFEPYAYDSIWFEISPLDEVEDSFTANVEFTWLDSDHWASTCVVSIPNVLQGDLSVHYYGSSNPKPLKDREFPICQY